VAAQCFLRLGPPSTLHPLGPPRLGIDFAARPSTITGNTAANCRGRLIWATICPLRLVRLPYLAVRLPRLGPSPRPEFIRTPRSHSENIHALLLFSSVFGSRYPDINRPRNLRNIFFRANVSTIQHMPGTSPRGGSDSRAPSSGIPPRYDPGFVSHPPGLPV